MSRTSEALSVKQKKAPATQYKNPWLEVAGEGGNEMGRLLKFVKGGWLDGDDVLKNGTQFVAHIDQLVRGYVKFVDGKVVEPRHIGKVADNYKPPSREELGDTDPKGWGKDADGKPRDPWVLQWFLPLIGVESGELITYVTSSKGGIDAVCDLCRIYGHKQRDGLLPIVALRTGSYKHKLYGKVATPDFQVVGWDDSAPKMAADVPVQSAISTDRSAVDADMNDEIPF